MTLFDPTTGRYVTIGALPRAAAPADRPVGPRSEARETAPQAPGHPGPPSRVCAKRERDTR